MNLLDGFDFYLLGCLGPASVTSANSTIRQNSITVEWDAPRGYVTSYRTNITDNNKLSDPMEVNTTWVEFDGLIAFSDYTVTICSKSYEEECENIYELNIQTLPDGKYLLKMYFTQLVCNLWVATQYLGRRKVFDGTNS